jgi:hypothetical protein
VGQDAILSCNQSDKDRFFRAWPERKPGAKSTLAPKLAWSWDLTLLQAMTVWLFFTSPLTKLTPSASGADGKTAPATCFRRRTPPPALAYCLLTIAGGESGSTTKWGVAYESSNRYG